MVVATTRSEASGSFTKVTASDVCADFALEEHRLRHLLLTKTALGSTFSLWTELEGKSSQINLSLRIVESDGTEKSQILVHSFWHPADHLAHKKSLAEIRELAQNNKMRDFKGWGLTDKRKVTLSNGKPAYFYTLMLSIPEYDKLATEANLLSRYKVRQREAERTGGDIPRADEPGDVEPGICARYANGHQSSISDWNDRGGLLEQFLFPR
jgi:hypothetical protein